MLAEWDRLSWRSKLDLFWRSTGAFWDALWLQPARLEDEMFQDLNYGARMLLKHKVFTAVAVVSLALGIGATTAIFSVVNAVLLQPLPYPQSELLVMIWERVRLPNYQNERNPPAPGNFADWRKGSSSFEQMAAIGSRNFNLVGDGEPLRVEGARVSASFFSVLQTNPELGRVFTAEEDNTGGRVAVLSHGLWSSRFGADPAIPGKTIRLDGDSYTVVGVMPAGFQFPEPDIQIWFPIALTPADLSNHGSHTLQVLGRLNEGFSIAQAQAEMEGIAETLAAQYPDTNTSVSVNLVPLREQIVGDVRLALLVLMAATALVLLIVCANVANLLMARATSRYQELAIRMALGAARFRVVRQLLTESLLLALIGGGLSLVLAYGGVQGLLLLRPDLPRAMEIGVNGPVLAFALATTLLTAFIFGVAPALQASRHDIRGYLKGETPRSAGRSRILRRNLLVAGEMALGAIVLVGAGLLYRSFARVEGVHLGFQSQGVLTLRVVPHAAKYPTPSQRAAFVQQAIGRVESLPGVQSVGMISALPLLNSRNRSAFTIEGRAPVEGGQLPFAVFRTVTPGYFRTMQIGLLEGRDLSWSDTPDSEAVIIINRAMAAAYWQAEDPIGKRIKRGSLNSAVPWLRVIGIVADVHEYDPITEPLPTMYIPAAQSQGVPQDWVVRTAGDSLALTQSVRSAIWEVDKDLPISRIQTMDTVRGDATSTQRFNLLMMGLFASLALALAITGVYGVTAYAVGQRTREIGIRMALGARTVDVLRLVVTQSLKTVVAGVLLGLIGAMALTRLMTNMLFGISPTDPATLVIVSLLLIGVAGIACYIPARRAAKSDPVTALHSE
jgi:putative ABC transport system permease protein